MQKELTIICSHGIPNSILPAWANENVHRHLGNRYSMAQNLTTDSNGHLRLYGMLRNVDSNRRFGTS
jgi:hypothetical protein